MRKTHNAIVVLEHATTLPQTAHIPSSAKCCLAKFRTIRMKDSIEDNSAVSIGRPRTPTVARSARP